MLSGCSDLNMENFRKHKLQPEMFFDFNTTSRINIDIDYGEYGAQTLVSIFAAPPLNSSERPLFKAYTDERGRILTSFEMPDSIKDSVFLLTSAIGTPQIAAAAVYDSTILFKYEKHEYSKDDIRTRVVDYPYFGYDNGNLHAILNWYGQYHGRVGDHNQLIAANCMVPAELLPNITRAFWNGASTRPAMLDNSASITGADINIVTTKDSVEVFFTFLTENTATLNSLGYYFYPQGKAPADFNAIQKYIIFPNTSVEGNEPYGNSMQFSGNNAPVSKMTTVQLLYVDYSTGGTTFSKYFPKDLEIGFFALKKGWIPNWTGGINLSDSQFIYTDLAGNNNGAAYFIRKDAEGYAVYGAECDKDTSFDDIMFTVQSSPAEGLAYTAAKIPDSPSTPDPEEPEDDDEDFGYHVKNEYYRTYCFEDLWPVKGDYDMNDVVIDHHSRIYGDNTNHAYYIIDDFTVCNRYMSAQVSDAFAVIIPEYQRGTITIPEGAYDETETGAIILFDNVQNHLGETVSIYRDLSRKRMSPDEIITDLDPFIIPLIDNDDYLSDERREVHMPKKQGTYKLDSRFLGAAEEAYFVDKDGKHPFAITIPLSVKDGEFTLTDEMKQIDTEYPYFAYWAASNGQEDKDWYYKYRTE